MQKCKYIGSTQFGPGVSVTQIKYVSNHIYVVDKLLLKSSQNRKGHEDETKILMKKKRVLLKLKWDADWALSPLPHAN